MKITVIDGDKNIDFDVNSITQPTVVFEEHEILIGNHEKAWIAGNNKFDTITIQGGTRLAEYVIKNKRAVELVYDDNGRRWLLGGVHILSTSYVEGGIIHLYCDYAKASETSEASEVFLKRCF